MKKFLNSVSHILIAVFLCCSFTLFASASDVFVSNGTYIGAGEAMLTRSSGSSYHHYGMENVEVIFEENTVYIAYSYDTYESRIWTGVTVEEWQNHGDYFTRNYTLESPIGTTNLVTFYLNSSGECSFRANYDYYFSDPSIAWPMGMQQYESESIYFTFKVV